MSEQPVTRSPDQARHDLLAQRPVRAFLTADWFPAAFRWAMMVALGLLVLLALFGPSPAYANPATVLIWVFWWPFLFVTILLFGRVWCGVLCPAGTASEFVNWRWGRHGRVPRALKSALVMGSLFVLITWWQGAAYLTHNTLLTAYFFLLIVGAAVLTGFLFGPRTWCRYLCPIGLLLGVYARLSPLELRPTPEKCRGCRTLECIRGDGRTPGCPMEISPRRLETNRHCIYCMNCVKACPHGSMQLRWRRPGAELLRPNAPALAEGLIIMLVTGLILFETFAMTATYGELVATLGWAGRWGGTAILFFGWLALFSAAYLLAVALSYGLVRQVIPGGFASYFKVVGYVFLPLALFGQLTHNLLHLEQEGSSLPRLLGLAPTPTSHVHGGPPNNLAVTINLGLVLVGLTWALWLTGRLLGRRLAGRWRRAMVALPLVGSMTVLALALFGLLSAPMAPAVQAGSSIETGGRALRLPLRPGSGQGSGQAFGDIMAQGLVSLTRPVVARGPAWSYGFERERASRLALSADGQWVAVGTDQAVYLFGRDGKLRWRHPTDAWVLSVALSADGRSLVAGTGNSVYFFAQDGTLRWQYRTGIDAHVSISADGNYVAAGAGDTVYFFYRDGYPAWKYAVTSGKQYVYVFGVTLSADGRRLVAAESYGNRVYYFDRNGALDWSTEIGEHSHGVAITPPGEWVPIGSGDTSTHGNVSLFDRGGRLLWRNRVGRDVDSVAVSADGRYVAAGSMDSSVYFFDAGGQLLWRYRTNGGTYVALSARADRLAVASADGQVYFLDGEGRLQWRYGAGWGPWREGVYAIGLSADGRYVVAASYTRLYYFAADRVRTTSPLAGLLPGMALLLVGGWAVVVFGGGGNGIVQLKT